MRHAVDLKDDIIQVPFITDLRQLAADPVGEGLAELAALLPQCFVTDHDAAEG